MDNPDIKKFEILYRALETEFRKREEDYHAAKRIKPEGDGVLSNIVAMNTIQRVLVRAGLARLEEDEVK